MTRRSVAAAFAGLLMVAGCATRYSETPVVINVLTTTQPKLRAASHWNVVASDVARQISASLPEKPPLFVDQSSTRSAFERAFSNQLISALVYEGFVMLTASTGARNVEIDSQVLQFSTHQLQYRYTGTQTALASEVRALQPADARTGAALPAGIANADAYPWFESEYATVAVPPMEIIVTISVSDTQQYRARSTSIYYIADTDRRMYVPLPPPRQIRTRNMEVTGQ